MRVRNSAHSSRSWYQSLQERASRDISTPRMIPTVVQAHLGDQALEPGAPLRTRARLAEVIVDHHHSGRGPAQLHRPGRESVLQTGRLLVLQDLLDRRLADVDDG